MIESSTREHLLEHGFCVAPEILDSVAIEHVRAQLYEAAQESERRGIPTRNIGIDPNEHNVRVFNLLDLHAVFRELIAHPVALEFVRLLLGDKFLVSNFTANIAEPGSGSMDVHSDQSLVIPEPWLETWSMNIIWCLDDIRGENGATLYLPGSHRFETRADVPADPVSKMIPFEAPAGSILVMDGRMWHTSGANRTVDEQRALLFGYYSRAFIRPQWNWNASLSPRVQASLDPEMRALLGLDVAANVRAILK